LTLRRADDGTKDEGGRMTDPNLDRPTTPGGAIAALMAGNERFVLGAALHPHQDGDRRARLATGQAPFAVLLGCSDSRVAAELVFDQGLGDLFVVRTAGPTLGPEVLGSIEYGVGVLQAPLVVVLGHGSCGAVTAALDAAREGSRPPGFIAAVTDAVQTSVAEAEGRGIRDVDGAVDVHVEWTVTALLQRSGAVADAVAAGSCGVVGMSYELGTGRVCLVTQRPEVPS
jgi:carbonic anhydrase